MLRFFIVVLLALFIAASAPQALPSSPPLASIISAAMVRNRLRYRDLLARGIVNNRVTLANWIRDQGFPPGQLTGPNTRTWTEDEVDEWLASRPTAPKPAHAVVRGRRGRPRKAA